MEKIYHLEEVKEIVRIKERGNRFIVWRGEEIEQEDYNELIDNIKQMEKYPGFFGVNKEESRYDILKNMIMNGLEVVSDKELPF